MFWPVDAVHGAVDLAPCLSEGCTRLSFLDSLYFTCNHTAVIMKIDIFHQSNQGIVGNVRLNTIDAPRTRGMYISTFCYENRCFLVAWSPLLFIVFHTTTGL